MNLEGFIRFLCRQFSTSRFLALSRRGPPVASILTNTMPFLYRCVGPRVLPFRWIPIVCTATADGSCLGNSSGRAKLVTNETNGLNSASCKSLKKEKSSFNVHIDACHALYISCIWHLSMSRLVTACSFSRQVTGENCEDVKPIVRFSEAPL